MNSKKNYRLCGAFSCFAASIPILQYYISPVSSFNLATFLVFVFCGIFVVKLFQDGKYRYEKLLTPMRVYIIFILVNIVITSSIFNYEYSWNNLSAYVRLLFLYISLLALGHNYFNAKKAFDFMENILFISAMFIFIHAILYSVFHIRFNPIIEPLVTTDSLNLDLNSVRSGGLYMEPAHYAQSAILYLCYKMFSRDSQMKLSKKMWIIIFGLLFSGSGQGYALFAVMYCLWIFYSLIVEKASTKKIIKVLVSMVVALVLLIVMLQIPMIQNAVLRIVSDNSSQKILGGQALAGRTYTNHYFHEFSNALKMSGVGFGHIADVTNGGYTNSLYSHLIQCGYPSVFILLYILVYYFNKGTVMVKVHVVLYAMLITFSAMANPMMLCFFIQFYIGCCKEKRREVEGFD